MSLFSSIAAVEALPLYRQINIGLVVAFFAVMPLLAYLPSIVKRFRGIAATRAAFPCGSDVATALFIAFVLTGICCMGELGTESGRSTNLAGFIYSQMISVCLFLPAVVRSLGHRATPVFPGNKLAWLVGGLLGAYFLIGLYALAGLPEWIARLTRSPLEQSIITSFCQAAPGEQIAIAASAVFLAPFLEEIFFRGYLYRVLRSSAGAWPAMVVVSLFFGAVHMSLVQCVPLAVFGFVLNLAYEKTGRLSLSMAMHAAFNAIGVAAVYAQPYLQHYLERHS